MKTPFVSVGILQAPIIEFTLNGKFQLNGSTVEGNQQATFDNGAIYWKGTCYAELVFIPSDMDCSFSLHQVTIGLHFHWERSETQTFRGTLKLIVHEGHLIAINQLPIETYLVSVISSEMKATSSSEFLKAHAVIARSWLLAQIERRKQRHIPTAYSSANITTDETLIHWYDREDHTLFDVCADDHCQRYQGITRADNPAVEKAVRATAGEVLMYDGCICDARFSKCCGGISELFSTCWEDKDYTYLTPVRDLPINKQLLPDLTREAEAERWIRTAPDAFCHTNDKHILGQILNAYDQETTDFYRWKVTYTQEELSTLVHERSGIDFGTVIDLIPIKRGPSGRLSLLRIIGTKRSLTIGKELEIRRILSTSHLFSSAFIIDKESTPESTIFTLIGAGWGHGVGLCQIGAAVMGEKGYSYQEILLHYYRGANIETLYKI